MPDQIYIGNFAKGLKEDRTAFVIDNDAFPFLYNFYVWRGRVKRKRGTYFLGQLQIQIDSVAIPANPWEQGPATLSGGSVNLISAFSLPANSTIVPGSISFVVGANTYTEPSSPDGTLIGTPGGTGTINYATGVVTITGGGSSTLIGTFSVFPTLPVMGLRDFVPSSPATAISNPLYPLLLSFDITYSYQINSLPVARFFNTTYYFTGTPFTWHGQNYQQFWTTNYQSSLWATNNNSGLHILAGTYVSGSGTKNIVFNFTLNAVAYTNLLVGDYLWFNEWPPADTVNGNTGVITVKSGTPGQYTVTFANNQTLTAPGDTGIVQVLTNSVPTVSGSPQDGIKYYTGDPTGGTGLPTGSNLGWVNFAPPLTATAVSIVNTPIALYYLVGALAIVPFKDRLLFFSPVIQTSTGVPIRLIDTVIWSWNGTPYYAPGDTEATHNVPVNETSNVKAYYVDQAGFGGFLAAGISQPIITVAPNEDVLIVGFGGDGRKTRFVYTGNDLQPFLFFTINSELPSSATFSSVTLDRGVLDIGQYGLAMTDQQSSQRVDLDIPDEIFTIQNLNFGALRVNSFRDFLREWIYFSYPLNDSPWVFPTRTFLFNYRDNTWAILYENFTAHGRYRPQTKKSWLTLPYQTWEEWREPWNGGINSPLFTNVIAGNPQGYVLILGDGTGEGQSGTITAIANDATNTKITSPNHCVQVGDYLYIQNAIGILTSTITSISQASQAVITTVNTFSSGQNVFLSGIVGMTELNNHTYTIVAASAGSITINVDSTDFDPYVSGGIVEFAFNGQIGRVVNIGGGSPSTSQFTIDIPFPLLAPGGYMGLGTFTRLSQPLLQTKQFPFYWNQGRQTRLCAQKYLMDATAESQVTVNIYLSQDPVDPWNDPDINVAPNSLVYSQLMFTCPEGTNLGLTPANVNLQNLVSINQSQIWHRLSTSLIGDSVQIGITLNDAQMRNLTFATDEITLHGIQLTVAPAGLLA